MRVSYSSCAILFLLSRASSAFLTSPFGVAGSATTGLYHYGTTILRMAYELVAEPEGGDELTALTTMPESRMKKMKEAKGIKSDEGQPYKFWMTAQADGSLIKGIHTQVLKDASKKANFPGFRKGQVPPYAMPQITQFALQESIIKTVEATVEAYGLKSLKGSDGSVEVHEELTDISKGHKVGTSVQFTATLNAIFDPEKAPQPPTADSSEVVIDAEVVADDEDSLDDDSAKDSSISVNE